MHYNSNREELENSSNTLFNKIISEEIKGNVTKIFDLKDASKAHLELHSRITTGSILLKT